MKTHGHIVTILSKKHYSMANTHADVTDFKNKLDYICKEGSYVKFTKPKKIQLPSGIIQVLSKLSIVHIQNQSIKA